MCFHAFLSLLFSLSQVFFSHSGPHCGRNTLPKKGFRYFIQAPLFFCHSGSPNCLLVYLFFCVHIPRSRLLFGSLHLCCVCFCSEACHFVPCAELSLCFAEIGMTLHQVVTFALEFSCFGFCCSQLESIHDHALFNVSYSFSLLIHTVNLAACGGKTQLRISSPCLHPGTTHCSVFWVIF